MSPVSAVQFVQLNNIELTCFLNKYCTEIRNDMRKMQMTMFWLLAGAARQPLFSVILSLSIYPCLFADFLCCKTLGNRLTPSIAYVEIAYGQTVDVHIIFPSPLRGCHYHVSPLQSIPNHEDISQTSVYEIQQLQPKRLTTCQRKIYLSSAAGVCLQE